MELFVILAGVLYGLLFGVIPTAGPTTALLISYIFLPYFYSDPYLGVLFYTALVAACTTGDTWSSILLGIPGSSSSAATVVDGYPMARSGRATLALSSAFTSSTICGIIYGSLVFFFMPYYAQLLLVFGPLELLLLNVFALSCVVFLVKENKILGLIGVCLGLLFGYVGVDENYAERLTFGYTYFESGIAVSIFVSGLFAVPELVSLFVKQPKVENLNANFRHVILGIKSWYKYRKVALTGGLIGSFVGALPGVHGIVADWLSYGRAKRAHPHSRVAGVVGPEGANNAVHAASFVPTVVFGIPGTPFAAVILSLFFMLHFELGSIDIQFDDKFFDTMAIGYIGGTILVGLFCLFLSVPITWILKVPPRIYSVVIFVLICWSCYQVTNTKFDLIALAICSTLGLLAKTFSINRPAILLAFILFPKIEALTFQTIGIYNLNFLN
jgi:TctA family transporter